MKLGDISVRFVDLMLNTAEDLGWRQQTGLRPYGLDSTQLSSPEARISIRNFMKLGFFLIEATGRPDLGLEMGRRLQATHFGLAGYAIMTAPNLERSLAVCIHFERLASENRRGSSRYYREGDCGVAEFYSISPYNRYNYFVADCILSAWVTLAEWLTGRTRLIDKVQFEFPCPGYETAYQEQFGGRVEFNSHRNAVLFRQGAVEHPVRYAQAAAHQAVLALCHQDLSSTRQGFSLADKIRRLVQSQPETMKTDAGTLAEQLGMTPWTLRRKLAKEGQTLSTLVDTIRKEMATEFLRSTRLRPSEIAWELGYQAQPSFYRAFRRWYGMSPEAWRLRYQSSIASSEPGSSS